MRPRPPSSSILQGYLTLHNGASSKYYGPLSSLCLTEHLGSKEKTVVTPAFRESVFQLSKFIFAPGLRFSIDKTHHHLLCPSWVIQTIPLSGKLRPLGTSFGRAHEHVVSQEKEEKPHG